jgi:radical SAM protein with 4Fe4S-binding SPASM domain
MAKVVQQEWEENFKRKLEGRTLEPNYVQWVCTYRCNYRCGRCGTAADFARPGELKTDEIMEVIDSLGELGCKLFSVTGGEPIMREDLWDVFKHAHDVGIPHVGFVTNGYGVSKFKKEIERAELSSILVSIDGYREHHDVVRGVKGAYVKCVEALEIFRDCSVPTRGAATLMSPEYVDDIPLIVKESMEHGATTYRTQAVIPEGRAKGKETPPETIKAALKHIYELRREGYPAEVGEGLGFLGPLEGSVRPHDFFCSCGWGTCTIMDDGAVMGCPAIEFPELAEGNIREKPFEEIWWEGFSRFRTTLYEDLPGQCKGCPYLKSCRGGCWLHRVNPGRFCFLDLAEEAARELGMA